MAVQNLTLPQFPTFNASEEPSNLFPRWEKYKKRFDLLCNAIGVTDQKQKLSMLLTYIGDETYEIYENITPATELTLAEVFTLFDEHFRPQLNVSYETYLFHQMKQRSDETIHQYYIRLKEQAVKCNFHCVDTAIKQQIELSTNNNKLRKYSFHHSGKTLQDLLKIGKSLEDMKIQTETLEEALKEPDVNAVTRNTTQPQGNRFLTHNHDVTRSKTQTCFNCGGPYPHHQSCPARGKTCNNCGKLGHFSKVCRSKKYSILPISNTKYKTGENHRNRDFNQRPLNTLDYQSPHDHDIYSIDNTAYATADPVETVFYNHSTISENLFAMSETHPKQSKQRVFEKKGSIDTFHRIVKVEGYPVKVLCDSGASVNILNQPTFEKLNKTLSTPLILGHTKTKVITYGADQPTLKVLGDINVLIETENKLLSTTFYVVNTSHKNLLSGTSAIALGIIAINVQNVETVMTSTNNKESTVNKESIFNKKSIFNKETKFNKSTFNKESTLNNAYEQFNNTVPERLKTMINTFSDSLFSGKIGKLTDYEVQLKIDETVRPVAQRERRIPFALRKKVNKKLAQLEAAGIIEDVTNEATPWINPLVIVPKGNDIRLCIDMRCANKAISRTRYPTPTVDDVLISVRGSKLFTKLDLNSAFHQLELSNDSRSITTFRSDTRIKRYKRLIFGVNSAQEELQHALREVLKDIEGVTNIADDILIYAKSENEHDSVLSKVLQRLAEKGLTLNLNKCIFSKENLNFFGYLFSSQGVKPNPQKVAEIEKTPGPENIKALRSFLGLMNYFKRFIPKYSTITHPLRNLLRNDTKWDWTRECEQAFTTLKNSLTSDTCNGYFDENKLTYLYTDASPVGISTILLQKTPGIKDDKIVSYSSRALSTPEQHYSQLEKECLAIVYACEHNRLYLYGRSFTIFNDNKAIVNLLNNPKSTVPLRIEKMTLRLQGYEFDLKYVKSEDNISDYPSRHPFQRCINDQEMEEFVDLVGIYACPNAVSLEDIKRETLKDPVLQHVANLTRNNTWYKLDKIENYPELKGYSEQVKRYRRFATELTISTSNDLILKVNRIILPIAYQSVAVKLAHIGHLGVVKTKALLRSKVYFPGMDDAVETEVAGCMSCQAVGKAKPPPTLNITPTPTDVWDIVNVDYLGPLPNGTYVFVIVDQKSKFPDIEFVSSTSAPILIKTLERIIATYGIPNTMVSDNGPPFKSYEIKRFMREHSIQHKRITPLWPQSNGEVERFMKPLMKIIRTAHIERKNWKSEVYKFLFAYRNTPHATTQIPPAELVFNRKCRYTIPNNGTQVDQNIHRHAENRIIESKKQAKLYQDNRRNAKDQHIQPGDRVIVKQNKRNKLTPNFEYQPYEVISTKGTMLTAQSNETGKTKTRNISHFKKISKNSNFPFIKPEEEDYDELENTKEPNNRQPIGEPILPENHQEIEPPQRKVYPQRIRRPISEWRTY